MSEINIDGLEKKTKGLEEDYQKLEDINMSVMILLIILIELIKKQLRNLMIV